MTSHSKSRLLFLRFLILCLIATTIYAIATLKSAGEIYDDVSVTLDSQEKIVKTIKIGSKNLAVPSYELFEPGKIWLLVSKKAPLSKEPNYTLVDIPVAHGDAQLPMKVADVISDELEQLVNSAEADSEPVMVSSAYRSFEEQAKTRDAFIAKNGKELASLYVSPVGSSEHHTGLSVDFSSVSDDCRDDSNACSLSISGAQWLAENAARYGFIQRYPLGQESITGVAFEPWHYRFVGKPMAAAMATSDLTYDEVVMQIAPGRASPR